VTVGLGLPDRRTRRHILSKLNLKAMQLLTLLPVHASCGVVQTCCKIKVAIKKFPKHFQECAPHTQCSSRKRQVLTVNPGLTLHQFCVCLLHVHSTSGSILTPAASHTPSTQGGGTAPATYPASRGNIVLPPILEDGGDISNHRASSWVSSMSHISVSDSVARPIYSQRW
jgi:hypothetical protein